MDGQQRVEEVRRGIRLRGGMHDVIAHPHIGEAERLRVPRGAGNRVGAVRLMRFDQVAVSTRVWRVPRGQLKSARFLSGEFFRVPLSARAFEIIEEMRALSPRSELVFPDSRDMTTVNFLRKLCRAGSWTDPSSSGRNISTHGFRTSFKGWAQKTKQDRAATELSLGHVYFGKVEAKYQPDDLLAERRELLDAWCLYCSDATAAIQRLRA